MPICDGRGDVDGGHCCWIAGEVCEFLNEEARRCSVWDKMGTVRWKRSPVGRWFADNYPGFNCSDWPQNIPTVMADGVGLCCWSD